MTTPQDATEALARALDRLLAVEHREDDQPCSCDECMSYGAEDEGVDWYRILPASRVAMRILDGADDRLAELAKAFRDHDAATLADPTTPQHATEAPQTFTRLQEAIEGERRFWHSVEVRPDDLALLLDFVASRAALAVGGWSVMRTEDVERLRALRAAVQTGLDDWDPRVAGEPGMSDDPDWNLRASVETPPPPLDAARLADAIWNVMYPGEAARAAMGQAAAIASEYARLSEAQDAD